MEDLLWANYLHKSIKQGWRHNFQSKGTNITASEASRKNLGLYPHIWQSGGTTAAKRQESLSDSVTQEYAWYNISTGHAFIGL